MGIIVPCLVLLLLCSVVRTSPQQDHFDNSQEGASSYAHLNIEEVLKDFPTLTADNFDDYTELTSDAIVLFFFHPDEPESKQVAAMLLQTQGITTRLGLNVSFAKVDGPSEAKGLSARFNAIGFPNLWFRSRAAGKRGPGKWEVYQGARVAAQVAGFIQRKLRNPWPEKLRTVADVEAFIDREHTLNELDPIFAEKPVVVGFFPSLRKSDRRVIEMRRFRSFIQELRAVDPSPLGAIGIHLVGSKHRDHKKDQDTAAAQAEGPATLVVKGFTVSVPSLVVFKRDGEIAQYNPAPPTPPTTAAAAAREEGEVGGAADEDLAHEDHADHAEEQSESEGESEGESSGGGADEEKSATDPSSKEGKKKDEDKQAKKEQKKQAKREKELERLRALQRGTSWRVTDMILWYRAAHQPLIAEVGHWNFVETMNRGVPLFLAWVDMSRGSAREGLRPGERFWQDTVVALKAVAKDYKGRFQFGYAGGDRYPQIAAAFGLSGIVGNVILNTDPLQSKYHASSADDGQSDEQQYIRNHIEEYLAGKLERFIMSEPVPPPEDNEDNTAVPVKTVVFNNFKKIVLDDTKDAIIELYLPDCPHCTRLAPVWAELGAKLTGDNGIYVAKMNLDANYLPPEAHVSPMGYPAIYFYPSNAKTTPISYDGDRSLASLLAFVKQHRTTAGEDDSNKLKEEL